jgi:acetyl esterase/lipase
MAWLIVAGAAGARPCIDPPADPANTYDAARTYAKLVRNYPLIRIASAGGENAPEVRTVPDLVYWQHGSRCLALDLYLPERAAAPLVVFVHGGGWQSGYRAEFAPLAARLAQRGYAAAIISYRLAGEAGYPAAVHDAQAAVRWLRAHASRYGFDPQRLVLAGGSAGGQIASLAGITAGQPGWSPAALDAGDATVQAIINIDGLSDFTSPAARSHEDDTNKKLSPAGAWLGGSYAQQTARWHEASPISHVRQGMPPILFIGSGQVRFAVGREAMREKMDRVGVASEVVMLADAPHSFWMFEPWIGPSLDAIVAFLGRALPMR